MAYSGRKDVHSHKEASDAFKHLFADVIGGAAAVSGDDTIEGRLQALEGLGAGDYTFRTVTTPTGNAVAEVSNDTLALVNGTGISVTLSAADTIMFSNTGYAPGGTDVAVADGGTGASTAAGALVNLGLTATAAELNFTDGVTSAIQTQLDAKQTLDATLTALAAFNTNGLLTQTAADTFAGRTLTGTANKITVSNGDGVSGNPTVTIPDAVTLVTVTATTINKVTITAPATSATLTLIDGTTVTGPAASGTIMTLGNAETVTGVKTFGTTTKLQFRDTGLFINSSVDGQLDISADTLLSLGVAGDISLGDSNLRVMAPASTGKIDLGTTSLRFNDICMSGNLNIESGNIIIDTSTGMKIGTGTTQLLGFWNATPVDRPTAYTQTYATATKTHTQTTMTDPAAYGAGANGYSTGAMASAIHAEVIALRANMIVVQGVVNSMLDDLQEMGLLA